ncbi:MAG: hypothetical protein AB9897_08600 [Anaerolineaceae bacterium]
MKKWIFLLPLLLFILSSCNLPVSKSVTNPADVVSTRVAQTLQAGEKTIIPTNTLQPTTALSTITPTYTETVSPTVTPSPDDPRLTLGTPDFSETFSSGSSFGLKTPYIDDAINMSIANGSLLMSSLSINGVRWRLAYPTPRNLYIEGTFKTIACSGSDFYGLVMRSPSYTDGIGYYLAISCSGQYSLMRMNGTFDLISIIDWTSDPAILSGANQENRVGVMLIDDQFNIYINGKLVQKTSNAVLTQKGYFGVFQSAIDNPSMTVAVEEIDEWNRP